ncbi:MAG: hypothetical protein D6690_14620 [Nitrospirae bacterium]|nr:MAG: hypothetical protein D6690_14620 [Nitrospirota bacterium]
MHALYHAKRSAAKWGGVAEDYLPIHEWLDATKELFPDCRHRALRHHSHGIFEAERLFGRSITTSTGKLVPVREIAELHIKEDCGGFIPSVSDWLSQMRIQVWMNRGYRELIKPTEEVSP